MDKEGIEEPLIIRKEPSEDETTPYFRFAAGILSLAGIITAIFIAIGVQNGKISLPINILEEKKTDLTRIETFSSTEEFKEYLEKAQSTTNTFLGNIGAEANITFSNESAAISTTEKSYDSSAPTRVSETNVQVTGVDEPDIVKTDGKNIYLSNLQSIYYPLIMRGTSAVMEDSVSSSKLIAPAEPDSMPGVDIFPNYEPAKTKLIAAFPPATLAELSSIDATGNLLYKDNALLVLGNDTLTGINITDKQNPKESWQLVLDNQSVMTARLIGNEVVVVTQKYIDYGTPCPIPLGKFDTDTIEIGCSSVHHPITPINTSTTYQVFVMDIADGKIKNKSAFVGDANYSVVYATSKDLYITYTSQADATPLLIEFYGGAGSQIFPESILTQIRNLKNLSISNQAKAVELQLITENYLRTLDEDERRKIENDITNKMQDFAKEKVRELQTTGIIKLNLNDLSVKAVGSVPGRPLNQFSLDEHEGNLRIAITVDSNWSVSTKSTNDVYILNDSLNTIGSLKDLGLDEQIYSVRFIEDKGYMVTFKQIDPFFVLNLENPKDPKVAGELKIPGFSSYLHPITANNILGIGQETGKVKLSFFNVENPNTPTETDKYILDEYGSVAQNDHHAFLHDSKHKIFFLPAGTSGYIFGYEEGKLNLEKVVTNANAQRAIFIEDYLYVIGTEKIVVLNESDWSAAGELSL